MRGDGVCLQVHQHKVGEVVEHFHRLGTPDRKTLLGGIGGKRHVSAGRMPGGIGALPLESHGGQVQDAQGITVTEYGAAAFPAGMEQHPGRIPAGEGVAVDAASAHGIVAHYSFFLV